MGAEDIGERVNLTVKSPICSENRIKCILSLSYHTFLTIVIAKNPRAAFAAL